MFRRAVPLVLLVLGLSACGAGAQPESPHPPSPTPHSVEATPTATPTDIAAEFAAQMQTRTQIVGELSGTAEVGDSISELSGLIEIAGGDSHQLTVVTVPDQEPQEVETISVGGVTYSNEGGIWIRSQEGAVTGGDEGVLQMLLDAALTDPVRLEVTGTERIGGDRLHRLEFQRPPKIAPEWLGLTDAGVADFEAAIAFLAEDDGTPAAIMVEATWAQGDEMTPAAIDMRFTLDWSARNVVVEAPDDPFEWHAGTEFKYRMVKPVDWTVSHEPAEDGFAEMDLYLGTVEDEVQVVTYSVADVPSAEDWYRASAQQLAIDFGIEPEFVGDIGVVDGSEVRVFRIFILHFEGEDGRKFFMQQATAFGGTVAWDINWFSFAGSEEADSELFMKLVTSFGLVD